MNGKRYSPRSVLDNLTKLFRTQFPALLLDQHGSKPAAFVHKHITPFIFVDVHEISASGTRSTKAMVTEWYGQGDVLTYLRRNPSASRIALVSKAGLSKRVLMLSSQAVQVSKALEHLHSFDIIHGNIYPVPYNEGSRAVYLSANHLHSYRVTFLLQTRDMLPSPISRFTPSQVKRCSVFSQMHHFRYENLLPTSRQSPYPLGRISPWSARKLWTSILSRRLYLRLVVDILRLAFTDHLSQIFIGRTPLCEPNPEEDLLGRHFNINSSINEIICDELRQLLGSCWARDPVARPSMSQVADTLDDIELYH